MITKNDPKLLAYRGERNLTRKRRMAGTLYKENEQLVRQLVTKLSRFAQDVDPDDLMQAGAIAFLYTIDHIDTTKTFSTYFAYRVWYEISKCKEKADEIYRPRGSGMPYKVLRQIEAFLAQYGREPDAAELGLTDELLLKWATMPVTTSIDQNPTEGASLLATTPDPAPSAEQHLVVRERRAQRRKQLACYTPEELAEMSGMSEDEVKEGLKYLAE